MLHHQKLKIGKALLNKNIIVKFSRNSPYFEIQLLSEQPLDHFDEIFNYYRFSLFLT